LPITTALTAAVVCTCLLTTLVTWLEASTMLLTASRATAANATTVNGATLRLGDDITRLTGPRTLLYEPFPP
jgi:hypothetical protein